MKKIALSFIVVVIFSYSNFIFSASLNTINPSLNWTGFYIGGNAGYWESPNKTVTTTGSPRFINQAFELGSSNIANALAQMAINNFWLNPYGFIGGGQAGYNYQYSNGFLLGVNIDFDGLTNSNNSYALQKTVNLVDFDESYVGSLAFKQKINYLGTVRARLGYLCNPTVLLYATGGFAYGNVTLDTTWTAQESLGPTVFPAITAQNNINKTLTGWTAGVGVEWLFKPHWSAGFEYTYYDLDNVNSSVTLAQINGSLSPAILWGSAAANAALSVAFSTIRVGINYHFS